MTALDWVHLTTEIPEAARRFERVATEQERAGIVEALELDGCPRLVVTYQIRSLSGGRYRVEGRIKADAIQSCVVTLDPVPQSIDEPFDVTFSPDGDEQRAGSSEREILSEPDVEPLADGRLEVGRVVFELLASALDPYPRKPGVDFEQIAPQFLGENEAGAAATPSPFAVLAKLKDKL